MNPWIKLFDTKHTIFANKKHHNSHYQLIASQISNYVLNSNKKVLDYCCGEALFAKNVSEQCQSLILAEPGPNIRKGLEKRFKLAKNIKVIDLEDVKKIENGSIDLIIMHSVSQYMTQEEINDSLSTIRKIINHDGLFIISDVVHPKSTKLKDALSLLKFGFKYGFFIAAFLSLFKTYFSSYNNIRKKHGFVKYSNSEIIRKLNKFGFSPKKSQFNLGHNQSRNAFLCYPHE